MDDDNTDEDSDYGSDDDIDDDNNKTKPYDYADATKMIINIKVIHILIDNWEMYPKFK